MAGGHPDALLIVARLKDESGMDKSDPSYKGQSGYNAAMLAIYDVWVLKFMTKAVWKVPVAQGVDRYRQHMGHRHLDVGPGTGYFIEKADPPRDTEITLLDPNQTVLRHVAKRLEERHPITVEADVMKPLPVDGPFDSAALSFVLHCLRGPEGNKAVAVRNIADGPQPGGGPLRRDGPRSPEQPYEARSRVPASSQQARGLRQRERHG